MTHYDLAVVGSGSGNTIITSAWRGRKVALIDGGTFGGTCLNVGCIPTKMLVYPAQLAAGTAEAARLGVDLTLEGARWRDIRDRIFSRTDSVSTEARDKRTDSHGVAYYAETARLTGLRALETASGRVITADQVVLAAGSRPRIPDVPGTGLPQVHTSDTIMRIDAQPRRLLIIGGGYIAAEFANIFGSLGTHVTVALRSGKFLRDLDATVSNAFTEEARRQWDVRPNAEVTSLEQNPDGSVRAVLDQPGSPSAVDVDLVLVATGRIPNGDLLGAADAGLDQHEDGRISVDGHQRVLRNGRPVDGLWALGDVSSRHQLKHVANAEARTVAHNLLHPEDLRSGDHRYVPAAVFTRPQIATVGLTEEEALRHAADTGAEITTAVQPYSSTAYGWAMEDTTGLVKLIAEKESGKILGAHLLGHEASMLIQPLVQAMSFGIPAHAMARGQYWIHPALTEVVENALLSLKTGKPDSPRSPGCTARRPPPEGSGRRAG